MAESHIFTKFQNYCRDLPEDRLPGEAAQKEMAPVDDQRPSVHELDMSQTRHSAVLILCALRKSPALLYTLRTQNLIHHSGQISFPGGRQESGESLKETACRETGEEVGIHPATYNIVRRMSPLYVSPSGFVIHPWLAFCDERPPIETQPSEVSEAFWVNLAELQNSRNIKTGEITYKDYKLVYPYWDVHSVPLWGATAMITSEIVTLYRTFLKHHR